MAEKGDDQVLPGHRVVLQTNQVFYHKFDTHHKLAKGNCVAFQSNPWKNCSCLFRCVQSLLDENNYLPPSLGNCLLIEVIRTIKSGRRRSRNHHEGKKRQVCDRETQLEDMSGKRGKEKLTITTAEGANSLLFGGLL